MNTSTTMLSAMSLIAVAGSLAMGAPRDVQIVSVDTVSRVFTVTNTGEETTSLAGWRFCSHNSSQVRRYTSPIGLVNLELAPHARITIHLNNDADAGNSSQVNATEIGTFADFELGAFAIGLYFPDGTITPFGDGNFLADHIQWSIGGVDNANADERSDEAEAGGVWTDQSTWISVSSTTTLVELNDPSFSELHGPGDYVVHEPCIADLTGDGELDFFDVSDFLDAFGAMDPVADFTGDGAFDFFDVSDFLDAFGAGCP